MSASDTYDQLCENPAFSRLLAYESQAADEEETLVIPLQRPPSTTESTSSTSSDRGEPVPSRSPMEKKKEGRVTWRVYSAYLRAGIGFIAGFLLLFGFFFTQQGLAIYSNWWLAEWSAAEGYRQYTWRNCTSSIHQNCTRMNNATDIPWYNPKHSNLYAYCVMVFALIVISIFRIGITDYIFLNAGRVLHNRMLKRIIRRPIHFFDLNLGQILNRFTKDVEIIDNQLPSTFFDFLYCLFQVLGAVTFVTILNPWSLIPAILAALFMLIVRSYFAQSSRDLKRIEANTRSPMFSQLAAVTQGLGVIRACHAEDICLHEFRSRLKKNTRVKYLFAATQQWAGIRFDWISLLFIALVTAIAMLAQISDRGFSPVRIALTLSYSLNLVGLFQWTIRQWVAVDAQMTAVERILEYTTIDPESSSEDSRFRKAPEDWPSCGAITYENVSMKHLPDETARLALHGASFTIRAGEKVGIVGRTGAGKSSMVQLLFGMGFVTTGRITIDDIDIATLDINDLRRRISIIPQNPVVFHGTLRSNLDPFNRFSDGSIQSVLNKMQLRERLGNLMNEGLDTVITGNGANISAGEKQLICLARAFLEETKILVIDEGTANVDNETARLIQEAIRDHFQNCTILTIAHRVDTILGNDRILVLGNGQLLEFDLPSNLLADPNSHFSLLINHLRSDQSNHLQAIPETDPEIAPNNPDDNNQ